MLSGLLGAAVGERRDAGPRVCVAEGRCGCQCGRRDAPSRKEVGGCRV